MDIKEQLKNMSAEDRRSLRREIIEACIAGQFEPPILVPLVWYKRLWMGIKYIFGYKCCYGNFEVMILSPKHARQIYNLYRFLNRPNLEKGDNDESKS